MSNTKSKSTKKPTSSKTNQNKNKRITTKPAAAKLVDAVNKKPTAKKSTTKKSATKGQSVNQKQSAAHKSMDMVVTPKVKKSPVILEPTTTPETLAADLNLEKTDGEDAIDYSSEQNQTKSSKTTKNSSRSKTRSFFNIFGKVMATLIVASGIFFTAMLIYLNILPGMYLTIAIVILVIITGGLGALLWFNKVKPVAKVPIAIISLLITCVYIVGGGYIAQTSGFLDNLKPEEYISEQYYVIVKNDSSYQDVKELKDKTVGTFDEGIEIYQEAIKKLEELAHPELKTVDSIHSMTNGLLSGELDAAFLSAVHKSVVDEDSTEFSQETKILYTVEIKVKLDEADEHPEVNVVSEPFTVYISGNDSYGGLSDRGRSDVNMLATVNPLTHEVLLTSIPRDYYVQLHGTTGVKDKLTHAGIYGVNMSVQTIEDLLGINIDYYVKVNFSTLVTLVDTIGGIEVYSDQRFVPWTNRDIVIPQGNVHMDGEMALAFARERKSYASGDRHRVQNQQAVLNAIIKKISSSTVILTRTNDILNNLSSSLDTNVGKSEISNLVKMQLQDMPDWQIGDFSLNGGDAHDYTYSFGAQQLYVMTPYPESVQQAHDYITSVMEGKSLTELGITQ